MKRSLCGIGMKLLIILSVSGSGTAVPIVAAGNEGPVPGPAENQQQQNDETTQGNFTIKVDAAMVTTDVTAIGASPSELRADDFLIYDNGIAQPLSHFSRDVLPLAIAILVDGSGSIGPYLPLLKIAALSALRHLRPEDQVALYTFQTNPTKLSDLTVDRLAIAQKINKLSVGSATNIFESIFQAANYLSRSAPTRRHAVILVSDNCHNVPSKHGADEARIEMLEASATLYGIKVPGDHCPEQSDQVKRIADETGGEILGVHASTSLQAALEKAVSNLRLQYTLGFSPSSPGEKGSFHRLTVRIAAEDRCPGCQLLARSGYYAGITAPFPPPNPVPTPAKSSTLTTDQDLVIRSILTAGTTELEMTDIPISVKTTEQTDSNGKPQLKVDIQIDESGIEFKTTGDRHACRLHVTVFYTDARGKIIGSDWKTIVGELREEKYNQVMETGISYSTAVPLKDKKQILKIVVYDEGSDRVGSRLVRLGVRPR
jgi:Ca-activated chloride channel homolog